MSKRPGPWSPCYDPLIHSLRRFISAGLIALLDGPELEGRELLSGAPQPEPHAVGRRNRQAGNWRPPLPPPVIDLTDQTLSHPELSETP